MNKIKFIILLFILIFFIWFILAYKLKSNVVVFLNEISNDNNSITYDKIKVRGFPFYFKIDIHKVYLNFINISQAQSIYLSQISLIHNYIHNITKIIPSRKILISNNITNQYAINLINDYSIILKYKNNILYNILNNHYINHFDNLSLNFDKIGFYDTNQNQKFCIEDIVTSINKIVSNNNTKYYISFSNDYVNSSAQNIKHMALSGDFYISMNNDLYLNIVSKIENLKVGINKSFIQLKGALHISEQDDPLGIFTLSLGNYDDLFQKLKSIDLFYNIFNNIDQLNFQKHNNSNMLQLKFILSNQGLYIDSVENSLEMNNT